MPIYYGRLRTAGLVFAVLLAGLAASALAASPGGTGSHRDNDSQRVDAYVLSIGESSMSTNLSVEQFQRLREKQAGDFLWFRRDGKTYLIDDAATLKQAHELFAPLRSLEPEREALSRRQEALSQKEEELDREQGAIDSQIDRLTDDDGDSDGDEDAEFMVSEESTPPTDEERAEIDRELDALRSQQESLRPREREIETQDRELDSADRALDVRESKLEREAEERLWSLIDASLKNGTAKQSPRP